MYRASGQPRREGENVYQEMKKRSCQVQQLRERGGCNVPRVSLAEEVKTCTRKRKNAHFRFNTSGKAEDATSPISLAEEGKTCTRK